MEGLEPDPEGYGVGGLHYESVGGGGASDTEGQVGGGGIQGGAGSGLGRVEGISGIPAVGGELGLAQVGVRSALLVNGLGSLRRLWSVQTPPNFRIYRYDHFTEEDHFDVIVEVAEGVGVGSEDEVSGWGGGVSEVGGGGLG